MTQQTKPNYLIPAIIFGMGIIPLFIGLFLFYNPQYLSGKITANGELLAEPLMAPAWLGESTKWRLLLVLTAECSEECQQMLYYARQVHASLKKEEQLRLERVLLVRQDVQLAAADLAVIAQQTPPLSINTQSAAGLTDLFVPSFSGLATINNSIFLLDPNGNIMLRHRPITEISGAKALLEDIKHLLRASRIG